MSRTERLRAELELAELEEELVAAKAAVKRCETCGRREVGPTDAGLDELRQKVRAARQAYREARGV